MVFWPLVLVFCLGFFVFVSSVLVFCLCLFVFVSLDLGLLSLSLCLCLFELLSLRYVSMCFLNIRNETAWGPFVSEAALSQQHYRIPPLVWSMTDSPRSRKFSKLNARLGHTVPSIAYGLGQCRSSSGNNGRLEGLEGQEGTVWNSQPDSTGKPCEACG